MAEPVQIFTPEYYERLRAIQGSHWWTLGMLDIMDGLLEGRLPTGESACFLDVGCGSGIGLAWARCRLPQARRIGVDASPFALQHCEGLGAELHLAEGSRLPVEGASVDLAICLDVLQHVEDDRSILREVARVSKSGGWFYARTNARSFGPAPAGSKLFTRPVLKQRLEESGFQVIRCSPVNAIGSLVGSIKDARELRLRGKHGEGTQRPAPEAGDVGFRGGGYGGGLRLEPQDPDKLSFRAKRALLRLEGWWIRHGGRLPTGHSLVALARRTTS